MDLRDVEYMYKKYYISLMTIACSYTHDKEDAEDLVQTVFYKAILSYEPSGSFLYWCNKVLKNEFYSLKRYHNRWNLHEIDLNDISSQDLLLSNYIEKENKRKLATMISILPLKYREVMIDSIYLEISDMEIAKNRGISVVNVRKIRSRAKQMLIEMEEKL